MNGSSRPSVSVQSRVRRLAKRAGVERQAQWVYEHTVPLAIRNRRDNEHQRLLMAFSLAEDANCIDVGAHGGAILREIVRCAPRGQHLAYEPIPELAARLRRDFPGVDVRCAAAGDRAGQATFFHIRSSPEESGFSPRDHVDAEPLTVRVERLDDALPDDYVPALIKIDVEGAELHVLRGAIATLRRHRPIVVFEHGMGGADRLGTTPRDVHRLLVGEAGLRIFDIDGGGPYDEAAFAGVFTERLWNFVAHP
jgi:FkbM family methyltransferase